MYRSDNYRGKSVNLPSEATEGLPVYSVGDELIYKGTSEFYRLPSNFGFPDNYPQYEKFNQIWGGDAVNRFVKEKIERDEWKKNLDEFLAKGNTVKDCCEDPPAKRLCKIDLPAKDILKFVYLSHNALPITKAYQYSAGYDLRRYNLILKLNKLLKINKNILLLVQLNLILKKEVLDVLIWTSLSKFQRDIMDN